jgi:hypothetical protein
MSEQQWTDYSGFQLVNWLISLVEAEDGLPYSADVEAIRSELVRRDLMLSSALTEIVRLNNENAELKRIVKDDEEDDENRNLSIRTLLRKDGN